MERPSDRVSLVGEIKKMVAGDRQPVTTVSLTCSAGQGLRLVGMLAQQGDTINRFVTAILGGTSSPQYWESAVFSEAVEEFITKNKDKNLNITLQLPVALASSLRERAIASRRSQATVIRGLLYLDD